MSNETRWFGFNIPMPADDADAAETKMSLLSLSGVMNLKPLAALKNLTVP